MKFLAVDLSSVFRPMWEAAEGQEFGQARQRTIRKIQGAADGYDRIVVARDARPYFRRALFPEYKANRTDPGAAYAEQMKLVIGDLRELGATIWVSPPLSKHEGKETYGEADDVLASFALWYQERVGDHPDWSLTILTGDTDLWALVDDELRIQVQMLDDKIVRIDQVFERFGVLPHLIPELKALAGDTSDNYKGFPGVGDTIAAAILTQLPSLQGVEDRSAADAIITAIVEGKDCPMKLAKNVTAALKEGGLSLLNLGRSLAYLRPTLRTLPDGTLDTLDFSLVLAEPKPAPRPVDPVYQQAAASQAPAAPAAVPVSAPAPSAAIELPQSAALARKDDLPFTRSLTKALTFAAEMHNSGLFRHNVSSPAACLIVLEHARAFGVPAVIAAQHAHCIRGRLGFGAQFMMAVILAHPSTKRFRFDSKRCSDDSATVLFWREGGEAGEYTVTIDDAKRAGYLGGSHSEQWRKNPRVMLCWMAARECGRREWPDVTLGIRGPDEIRDGTMSDGDEFPEAMLEEDG